MLILSILLLPLIGSGIFFFLKGNYSKYGALLFALLEFLLTMYLWHKFRIDGGTQFQIQYPWLQIINSRLHFGVDGLALLMLLLTNTLAPIIIFSSLKDERPAHFYALILLMQFGLVGIFTSLDGLLFYLFWEVTLIPIWFICGLFGTGENKTRINLKFFIYTFFGSLFMLIGLIYAYLHAGSFDLYTLYTAKDTMSYGQQTFLFWLFFLAFAIKLPIFPFHTWQADTYATAPTQGSMLLAGIMLKMGVFGLMRYLLPLAPLAVTGISGGIALTLAIVSVVYASLIAVVQKDIKRLIAFSSMAHVGLIAAGIFAAALLTARYGLDVSGMEGASVQMLAHGVNVVGLFYAADVLMKNFGTRDLSKMGGLASKMPVFAVLFMIISVGTMAVPLTNAFIGEFLLLKSIFSLTTVGSIFAGLTLILCAVYVTKMYAMSMFGKGNSEFLAEVKDLSLETKLGLGVLAALVFIFGVYPQPLLSLSVETVTHILRELVN